MRVVLRSDVDGVGKRGDICDVTDGYGRNFLVPKGYAFPATPGVVAQANAMRKSRDLKDARERSAAEAVARQLVPMVIRIPARAGAEGRLFGSITASELADAIKTQSGADIDRRRLHMGEPIRSLGMHEVPVRLHPEVEFRVTVEVTAQ